MAVECAVMESSEECGLQMVHGGAIARSPCLQDKQSCGGVSREGFVGVAV